MNSLVRVASGRRFALVAGHDPVWAVATCDYRDETVPVTGGSSGTGRAIALEFGRAGATVLNADSREEPRDVDATEPTHRIIESEDGTAAFVETDVAEPAAIEAATVYVNDCRQTY